jgi:hypothetical protein
MTQVKKIVAKASELSRSQIFGTELSEQHRLLVRETVTRLAPARKLVAAAFRRRLLDLDPSLVRQNGLAKSDGRRFLGLVKLALLSLDPAGMLDTLALLGKCQKRFTMPIGQCLTYSRALIWTFEQSLETRFSREAKDAWAALLAEVSCIMAGFGPPRSVYGRLLVGSAL